MITEARKMLIGADRKNKRKGFGHHEQNVVAWFVLFYIIIFQEMKASTSLFNSRDIHFLNLANQERVLMAIQGFRK